jgi:hypothetical protein
MGRKSIDFPISWAILGVREQKGAVLGAQKGAVMSKRGLFIIAALGGMLFALLGLRRAGRGARKHSLLV